MTASEAGRRRYLSVLLTRASIVRGFLRDSVCLRSALSKVERAEVHRAVFRRGRRYRGRTTHTRPHRLPTPSLRLERPLLHISEVCLALGRLAARPLRRFCPTLTFFRLSLVTSRLSSAAYLRRRNLCSRSASFPDHLHFHTFRPCTSSSRDEPHPSLIRLTHSPTSLHPRKITSEGL